MNRIGRSFVFTLQTVLLLMASPALSQAGFVDTFSYPNGELNGQGGWTANTSVTQVVNGEVQFTGNNDNAVNHALSPSLSDTFYVSFNFRFDIGAIGNNDFFGLWFNSTTGPNIGLKGNQATDDPTRTDFFIRLSGSGGNFADVNAQIGVNYLIVGKFEKVGANFETMTLWINPSSESSASIFAMDGNAAPPLTQLGVRTVNLDSGDAIYMDNLKIGDSFAAVTTPAPPGAILAGIGSASLVGFRVARRRRVAMAA